MIPQDNECGNVIKRQQSIQKFTFAMISHEDESNTFA